MPEASLFCLFHKEFLSIEKHKLLFTVKVGHMVLSLIHILLDEAALSFLGMGVQPPAASLGNMLNGAQSLTVLTKQPWLWIPPGLMIVILVIAINFIGDALRDALDPNSKN